MIKWFDERYISREEHQKVVAYYRNLVSQLYGNVRDLRQQVEATAVTDTPRPPLAAPMSAPATDRPRSSIGNVIRFDFRRARP